MTQQVQFDVDVYEHDYLVDGQRIDGPAIIEQKESTVVVGPGDRITVDAYLNLVIELAAPASMHQQEAS